MTSNHDYNTPKKGATDWHIPLNENFEKIDTDVEIRDQDANRGGYEPKKGSKYLAIDTGTVYIGDGTDWQTVGSLTTGTEASGNSPAAAVVSTASELQDAIDRHHNGDDSTYRQPVSLIEVQSGTELRPSSRIDIKPGVAVNFNGARLVPTGDFDVVLQYPNTFVDFPIIDVGGIGWSSKAWQFNADIAGMSYEARNSTILTRPQIRGDQDSGTYGDTGTAFYLTDSSSHFTAYVKVQHYMTQGFDYVFHIEATDDGKWVNANQFHNGHISDYLTGIKMEAEGSSTSEAMTANSWTQLNTQPIDYGSRHSDWLFDINDGAQRNYVQGIFMDPQLYVNDTVWRIGKNAKQDNVMFDSNGFMSGAAVKVERSGGAALNGYLNTWEAMSGNNYTL